MILTNIERLALEIVLVGILIIVFALYERHRGAQVCVAADRQAVLIEKTHNADVLKYDGSLIAAIEDSYHAAKNAPSLNVPPLRDRGLCIAATPVLPDPAAAAVRSYDRPGLPRNPTPVADIGPLVLAQGRDADAQVVALQSYISRVCQAPR